MIHLLPCRSIFLFILLFISDLTTAQIAPPIDWAKCFGGTFGDQAASVIQTFDGGFVTVGYTASNNGNVTGNHGDYDCWIIKTDSAGTLLWQKCLGGSNWDQALDIKQTPDSGYIMTGFVNSNNGDVSGNHGGRDVWVVKMDATGNLQWQKCFGGTIDDSGASIVIVNGGYVIGAGTNSTNGDITSNHGMSDYWIFKIDDTGNLIWQKTFGGSERESIAALIPSIDGGFVASGWTESNDGDVAGNHDTVNFTSDYWVIKIDSIGNFLWQKCLGGSYIEIGWTIVNANDGGYAATGWTFSSDGDVTANNDSIAPISEDYWLVRLDSSGNVLWQKCYGGEGGEDSFDVCATSDNGFILVGTANMNNGNVTGHHGPFFLDNWIVKVDSLGNIEWQNCYGGSSGENAMSVIQTADSGYAIAGMTISNDFDVTGNHGNADFWLFKLDGDLNTGINNPVSYESHFSIVPNPCSNEFSIEGVVGKSVVRIYDMIGNLLIEQSIDENNRSVNTSKLANGIYLIKQFSNSPTLQTKIVVSHF